MRKLSRKRAENVAGFALLVQFVICGLAAGVGAWVNSQATLAASWFLLLGLPVWFLSWLLLRFRRLAEEEDRDWERLEAERRAGRGDQGALFVADEKAAFVAKTRLAAFEKWGLPIASLVMSQLLAGLAALRLFDAVVALQHAAKASSLAPAIGPVKGEAMAAAAIIFAAGFIGFLLAMYARGMARQGEWRPLRAGASYLMGGALSLLLACVALAFVRFDIGVVETVVTFAIPTVMGFVAVEVFLNFILDFYRPRISGLEMRPSYDSRLLGLLSEPGGILRTVAATMDYQFGFKVSETWFYRFLERAILPLLVFDVIAFYLLTCVVIVQPQQQVIIENLGEVANDGVAYGPGLHLKWPWPFSKVEAYPAAEVKEMIIGAENKKKGVAVLWTIEHYEKEYEFLVATGVQEKAEEATPQTPPAMTPAPAAPGPAAAPAPSTGAEARAEAAAKAKARQHAAEATREAQARIASATNTRAAAPPVNLISCTLSLQYRIKSDPHGLYNYLYHVEPKDVPKLLDALAYRELTLYLAHVDLMDIMSAGRTAAREALRERIQKAADVEQLGIEIVLVGLVNIHPPVGEVGQAYENVVAAEEGVEAKIIVAEGYRNEQVHKAGAEKTKLIAEARADAYGRGKLAAAEANRFENQLRAYEAAPEVYPMREYLRAMENSLQDVRKYIVFAGDNVSTLTLPIDLEEAKRPDIVDVSIGEPGKNESAEESR